VAPSEGPVFAGDVTSPCGLRPIDRLLLAALGYGALIFLVLPTGVVVQNDDFGYLRSVVETLRHGRLWTDDWLEPWAGGLSAMAASVVKTTGSFFLATNGLLAVLAAIGFGMTSLLLRARGCSVGRAVVVTALLFTMPSLLWKTVEFTGIALYVPCLLLALHAAERNRWVLFLLAWALALITRQSAIAWGALPAVALVSALWRRPTSNSTRAALIPALVAIAGVGLFVGFSRAINPTHARTLLANSIFRDPLAHLRNMNFGHASMLVMLCGGAFLVAVGLRSFALGTCEHAGRATGVWRRLAIGVAAAVIVAWLGPEIAVEHGSFNTAFGQSYLFLLLGLSVWGWWSGVSVAISGGVAIAALAGSAILAIRGAVWDYYLLDIALFGFFAGPTGAFQSAAAPNRKSNHRFPCLQRAAITLLVVAHGLFLLNFKVLLDRNLAFVRLAEDALRRRLIQPSELAFTPFGYQGWHLYPYYLNHEGRTSVDLGGFVGYVGTGTVAVGQAYSRALHVFPRFRHEPPADRHALIGQVRFRCCWFFHGEFFLLRSAVEELRPPKWSITPAEYQLQPYPLNDAEWRELVSIAQGAAK
jgi:hypothetical protein